MITKQQFIKYIFEYKNFDDGLLRLEKAISGNNSYDIFNCDWAISVEKMLDIFLESYFTDKGIDIITWWLFESVDHIIWQKTDPDLFSGKSEIEYNVNELEDLWNYLIKYKEDYILND